MILVGRSIVCSIRSGRLVFFPTRNGTQGLSRRLAVLVCIASGVCGWVGSWGGDHALLTLCVVPLCLVWLVWLVPVWWWWRCVACDVCSVLYDAPRIALLLFFWFFFLPNRMDVMYLGGGTALGVTLPAPITTQLCSGTAEVQVKRRVRYKDHPCGPCGFCSRME